MAVLSEGELPAALACAEDFDTVGRKPRMLVRGVVGLLVAGGSTVDIFVESVATTSLPAVCSLPGFGNEMHR